MVWRRFAIQTFGTNQPKEFCHEYGFWMLSWKLDRLWWHKQSWTTMLPPIFWFDRCDDLFSCLCRFDSSFSFWVLQLQSNDATLRRETMTILGNICQTRNDARGDDVIESAVVIVDDEKNDDDSKTTVDDDFAENRKMLSPYIITEAFEIENGYRWISETNVVYEIRVEECDDAETVLYLFCFQMPVTWSRFHPLLLLWEMKTTHFVWVSGGVPCVE